MSVPDKAMNNVPQDVSDLLQAMATDFPAILHGNLVGLYLWGSLTYDAFDKACSSQLGAFLFGQSPDARFQGPSLRLGNGTGSGRVAAGHSHRQDPSAAAWRLDDTATGAGRNALCRVR